MRALALVAGLLLAAAPAGAEPRLGRIDLTLEDERVYLGLRLEGAFDDAVRARIESGLPTGFVYEIELLRHRSNWFNSVLKRTSVQVAVMYNAVTGEYLVNTKQDGRLIDSRLVRDFEVLERVMTRFERLPVFTLEGVSRRYRLRVRARAKLVPRTVFTVVPTTVTTDWVESGKFRRPGGEDED